MRQRGNWTGAVQHPLQFLLGQLLGLLPSKLRRFGCGGRLGHCTSAHTQAPRRVWRTERRSDQSSLRISLVFRIGSRSLAITGPLPLRDGPRGVVRAHAVERLPTSLPGRHEITRLPGIVKSRDVGIELPHSEELAPETIIDVHRQLIEAADAEPVLVLAAGGDVAEAAEIVGSFAAIGARRMVVTRLDISRRLGAMLVVAEAGPLAFSDVSFSPQVARGLKFLTPQALARLLMRDPLQAAQHDATPKKALIR